LALEDVKENIKERANAVLARAQESTAWMQIMEKYNELSPLMQKLALVGSVLVIILLLLIAPGTFYFSSQDYVEDFENKRNLIRELFHVSHDMGSMPPLSLPVSASDLESRARTSLTAKLQPEQIAAISSGNEGGVPKLPKDVNQAALTVSLSKLNLIQVLDIGHELQMLHPTARMIGLSVKANTTDQHYFDVIYKIVAFSAKPEEVKGPAGKDKKSRGKTAGGEK
jgi:hypothetical protein